MHVSFSIEITFHSTFIVQPVAFGREKTSPTYMNSTKQEINHSGTWIKSLKYSLMVLIEEKDPETRGWK